MLPVASSSICNENRTQNNSNQLKSSKPDGRGENGYSRDLGRAVIQFLAMTKKAQRTGDKWYKLA